MTDSDNHRVVKIRLSDGQIVDAFGSSGSGYDNFTYPTYLAVDSRNDRAYIFVVDAGNYRIIKLRHDANGTRRVNSYSYSGDWVINGIECDKFGHLWLTDQNNHQIIRMNSLMELVFSDCSYGTGQTPGILNQPIDIDMDYKTVLNYQGVPQQNWYFDLLFATEKWSNNSGQVYYQTRPKKVQNSFSYQAVFEVPQDDDEIQLESLQHSEPNSADPPVEAVLKTWL
ncbi:MAG: hypothetical protein GWN62_12760, partial [Aliifodinibius sp.]|nr:hypothetical protein [Fodinibius sp.]